jgi:DNA-binding Lrp family transcriptional regulator
MVEKKRSKKRSGDVPGWTFLSNHFHVLSLIARNPEITLREVADWVGITERAVQRIVADLEAEHYLERERSGRRNRYKVHPELPLRHPVEAHLEVGALIALMMPAQRPEGDEPRQPPGATDGCDEGRQNVRERPSSDSTILRKGGGKKVPAGGL